MNHPLIWAHRGASGYAPENTIPAFLLAAEMGTDEVELDVQLTRDGEAVVCHDESVDRTSNGAGFVKDFSLAELKELCPEARTGLLYADGLIDMPAYGARLGADALHPAYYNLQYPDSMEDSRKYGLDVNVWTVNTENELLACRDLGVHAVITNYPKKAAELYQR